MENDVKVWLYVILNAIMEIETFWLEQPLSFPEYEKDIRTKRAVERNIEIIGEAMNRVLYRNQTISLTNSRKFVDIRNRIIHGYDSVSDEAIWGILTKHLPILQKEIETLLSE